MTTTPTRMPLAVYQYIDERGTLLYEVLRFEPKDFLQRRPLADGKYEWNLNGARRVPYRLPELSEGIAKGHTAFVVEGEKDAETLTDFGLCATTNCGGANWEWTLEFVECFRGAPRIVVIPDCDEGDPTKGTTKGREAAQKRAERLLTVCDDVRIVDLDADRHDGYDVSDWIAGGRNVDELFALVEVAPRVVPAGPSSASSSDEVWPELTREVDTELLPPPMPQELLPEPLRRRVEDVCERMCVPIEMLAAPIIVALAALVGRTLGIRPKRRDDWLVVPNLWGGIVARPGLLKTPAIAEAMKPLGQLAKRAREQFDHDREHAVEYAAIVKLEVEVLESQLKGALKKSSDEHKIEVLREQLAAKKSEVGSPPTERRYITHDATTEKLGELLCENPRGLLQLRDELAGWLRIMDKPGREGDRAFYLEAWNGTGSYTFDRIGRGTIHIPALTLSAFGGITPGALRSYIGEALTEGRGADGLLQRLQVVVWPGAMPEWKNVDRAPDAAARDRVFTIFERLDALAPVQIGATCGEHSEIPYLRFSPDGQDLFDAWHDELEHRLRSDDLRDRPAFESHLAKQRSLMPSLALLFYLIEVVDGHAAREGVSGDAARLAAAWCEYLELHAERVYAAEGARSAAGALARRIERGDVRDGDTVREVRRHEWFGLNTQERVESALAALEAADWIRLQRTDGGPGRPSSPVIQLHPDLRGYERRS